MSPGVGYLYPPAPCCASANVIPPQTTFLGQQHSSINYLCLPLCLEQHTIQTFFNNHKMFKKYTTLR